MMCQGYVTVNHDFTVIGNHDFIKVISTGVSWNLMVISKGIMTCKGYRKGIHMSRLYQRGS